MNKICHYFIVTLWEFYTALAWGQADGRKLDFFGIGTRNSVHVYDAYENVSGLARHLYEIIIVIHWHSPLIHYTPQINDKFSSKYCEVCEKT